MDTDTAINTVTAIPISITMVMAMGMEETKIKKCMTHFCPNKKTTADRWFFYECYFLKKIISVEILESIPTELLVFLKGLSF